MCIRDRAKTDLEITLEVAKRFGFEQYFNEDPEVYIKRVLEPTGVTYDELVEKKGVNMWERNEGWIAYKDGQFFTSTGKAHLWVQKWVDEGFPPIACHQRPADVYKRQGWRWPRSPPRPLAS